MGKAQRLKNKVKGVGKEDHTGSKVKGLKREITQLLKNPIFRTGS